MLSSLYFSSNLNKICEVGFELRINYEEYVGGKVFGVVDFGFLADFVFGVGCFCKADDV